MLDFVIPPKNYSQAEAFQLALEHFRKSIPREQHRGFHSVKEIVAYLNDEIRLRPQRPIRESTVRYWIYRRYFTVFRPRGTSKREFVTTNLHLFAFLYSMKDYRPKPTVDTSAKAQGRIL